MKEEPGWTPFESVIMGGIPTCRGGREELARALVDDCLAARQGTATRPRLVFDVNGQGLSLNQTDAAYREALAQADLVHADGEIIVRASRWLTTTPITNRSATTDMIHDAAKVAVESGLRFFLLGGEPGLAEECAKLLQEKYEGLEIAGTRDGYFSGEEVKEVIAEINESKADVVWVGLGKPKEQAFCAEHGKDIQAGWMITCGGCFNFVTGAYSRAPQWMQRFCLEWVHRLLTNPRKLFLRYLTTTPHALFLLLFKTSRI